MQFESGGGVWKTIAQNIYFLIRIRPGTSLIIIIFFFCFRHKLIDEYL